MLYMNNIPDKDLSIDQLKQIRKFFLKQYNECKNEVINKNNLYKNVYNNEDPCMFLMKEHFKYCSAYKEKVREKKT